MNNKSLKKYFPIFVLPTLIAFVIAFVIPFVMGIYLSFCKFNTIRDAEWVGIKNYMTIFTEDKATGMYARYDECHEQRAYTEDEIKSCLKETSLRLVKSWTEDEVRTYFVIQR